MKRRSQAGFTLLEVLIATLLMGIAVAGVLSAISATTRNAARLTQYDRATLLARQKLDELLVDQRAPRKIPLTGQWSAAEAGGIPTQWRAVITPFEAAPGAAPGQWVLDRVELQLSWMDGATKRGFALEGFRRGVLRPGDL
jgi:general secretion pathway protein I